MKALGVAVGCWLGCLGARIFVLPQLRPGSPEWIVWICFSSWVAFAVGAEFILFKQTKKGSVMVDKYGRMCIAVFLWAITIFVRGAIIDDLHPWQITWLTWVLGLSVTSYWAGWETIKMLRYGKGDHLDGADKTSVN